MTPDGGAREILMTEDIRNRSIVCHRDIAGLNFIRSGGSYVFRRHHRNGLRSHVMEVLRAEDVEKETKGVVIDGLRWFPSARPLKMLRLFRRRFGHFSEVLAEIRRVKTIERYLTVCNMARSHEFIVEYRIDDRPETMLCGLQEFVSGVPLNPWHRLRPGDLPEMVRSLHPPDATLAGQSAADIIATIQRSLADLAHGIRTMIRDSGYVPDLAGEGNLLLTPSGDVKLVDINNISRVSLTETIPLDDIGYPVCDKSIEALSLIEQCLLERPVDMTDPVYRHFLAPERRAHVAVLDRTFHRSFMAQSHGKTASFRC